MAVACEQRRVAVDVNLFEVVKGRTISSFDLGFHLLAKMTTGFAVNNYVGWLIHCATSLRRLLNYSLANFAVVDV